MLSRTLSTNAPVRIGFHEGKTSKSRRSQVMLQLFRQLPLDCPSKIPCQEPNYGASHHTSLHTQLRKDRIVTKKNPSTDKKSVSSNSNLQIKDQDTGTSTQFQRSQNQNNSRQPQFNAAAIDKFLKKFCSVLQIIPVSKINGHKTFDTYALIDPGSTGTYIVDDISSFLSLKTGKEYKLDVQFLSLSRSLSVSAT